MSQILLRRTSAAVILVLTGAILAQAEDTNWGKWGADDQIGTLNYITPEVVRNATRLVKKCAVYSLAIPLAKDQPSENRRLEHFMTDTGQGPRPDRDTAPFYTNDWLSLPTHGTTHWDSLAHIFGDGKMYNGYDASTNITAAGALKNGIQHAANKLVTRGVLLDIARYKGVKRLEPGYVITVADIEGAARQENVSFQPGDVILIRTGWLSLFHELNLVDVYDVRTKEYRLFHRNEPGIGWAVSQWLKTVRAAAVAADNLYLEALPCEAEAAKNIGHPTFEMPVNYELIRNQGMMLGKVFQLDELAQACAADGVYEFFFVSGMLNLTNGTGSPTNPLAIK
jgi:kynurenine formamidase